ncbi:Uncharacterised protein [Chlamydia trachomatis]|nr:Uncharacterised protein [Chlamydia trachomatis]
MSNTRGKVTSRVDCVSGGATERVTNDDDDQCNAERANRGFGVAGDEDPEDQDEGADGLSEGIPESVANLGSCREDAELEGRVEIFIEVLLEGQPAQDGANECTEELGDDVDRDVRGGHGDAGGQFDGGIHHVADNLSNGDRRVQVTTRVVCDVDACENCEAPSPVNHEPTATVALGLGQEVGSNDATTEEEQDCCTEELGHEDMSGSEFMRRKRKKCCEHFSNLSSMLRCIELSGGFPPAGFL